MVTLGPGVELLKSSKWICSGVGEAAKGSFAGAAVAV